ncbi:MAG: hypothetical protein AB1485_00010 [Candidatus Thermoplasmatota archaeon]
MLEKADAEKEYGAVIITDHLKEKLLSYAHYIAKNTALSLLTKS